MNCANVSPNRWHSFCCNYNYTPNPSFIMEHPDYKNLKYGIIYLFSDRRYSPGLSNPEDIVEKFVHPLQVEWIDEPGREDLLLIARRFNVGNIGRYATVSLTLNRMNRSGGWFEAIRHFADALMGVADAGDGDITLHENDFVGLYDKYSSVFGTMCEAAPQDHTHVEKKRPKSLIRLKKKLDEVFQEDTCKPVVRSTKSYHESRDIEPDYLELEEERELKAEKEYQTESK